MTPVLLMCLWPLLILWTMALTDPGGHTQHKEKSMPDEQNYFSETPNRPNDTRRHHGLLWQAPTLYCLSASHNIKDPAATLLFYFFICVKRFAVDIAYAHNYCLVFKSESPDEENNFPKQDRSWPRF